jgi:RluA family pseudouridine synthase
MKNNFFEIIHADDQVVVVNKAANVLSIPDRFAPEKFNLSKRLEERYGEIFVVHRLDKETSGIIVFCRTPESHKHLSEQFFARTIKKVYLTLVEGCMHQTEGVIDKPIAPDPIHPDRMVVAPKGRPSVTNFRVKEAFRNYSLVEAEIKTGRTHQIRVHFQSIGYPLAIDALYGRQSSFLLSSLKQGKYVIGKDQEERPLMSRSSLHSFSIDFIHPSTGKPVYYEASLPKDFLAVINQLRKWGK